MAKSFGIIQDIIEAKPTDGLWGDDRTDEDQIGATYDELEWAMSYLEHSIVNVNQELSSRQNEVLEIYKKLNIANQHKMKPIPVCLIKR